MSETQPPPVHGRFGSVNTLIAFVRAVHLDIVPDMTAQDVIRSFKWFTSRRGFLVRVVTDNTKTFKAAARTVSMVLWCSGG